MICGTSSHQLPLISGCKSILSHPKFVYMKNHSSPNEFPNFLGAPRGLQKTTSSILKCKPSKMLGFC